MPLRALRPCRKVLLRTQGSASHFRLSLRTRAAKILEVTHSQNSGAVDDLDRDPRLEALEWYMDEERGKPVVSDTGGSTGNGAKAEASEVEFELGLNVAQISGEKLFVSAITEHTTAVAAGGSGGCSARMKELFVDIDLITPL